MTNRTKVAEVRIILPESIRIGDVPIKRAIATANLIVTKAVKDCAKDATADSQREAEKYLAAHLVAISEGFGAIVSEDGAGCGGNIRHGTDFGTGVLGTVYGQAANTILGGCLAQIDGSDKAKSKSKIEDQSKTGVGFFSVGSI